MNTKVAVKPADEAPGVNELRNLVRNAQNAKDAARDAAHNAMMAEERVKEKLLQYGMLDCLSINWGRVRKHFR